VYVSDHTVPVECNEATGEPNGVVQLETSDPGDEDLDGGLLLQFLVGHAIPRERGDDAVPGCGSSALGVVLVILAHADLEVHPLTLYRDLAGEEGVPALLWGDLYGLVDCDLERAVVEARETPTSRDFVCFPDNALGGQYRCVPIGQDDLDLGRPCWVIVRDRLLAVLGLCEVDSLCLQLVVRAVVHSETFDWFGLVEDDGDHEDDGCPEVGAEAVPYGHPMKSLSLAVEAILYLSALLVVPQDAFLYFL
jgi:hypothetical protein